MITNQTWTLFDELDGLYQNTLKNCEFYQKEKKQMCLTNEIGVLRGIYYCMQAIGFEMEDETEFLKMIELQQKLKGKEMEEWLK